MAKTAEKKLNKMSKEDLASLLLDSYKEIEELRQKLQQAEEALNDRNIRVGKTGSIAEAALELNGVFEAAQKAADQYVENILEKYKDTDDICSSKIAQAEQRAERIVKNAEVRAKQLEEAAKERVENFWADASNRYTADKQKAEGGSES